MVRTQRIVRIGTMGFTFMAAILGIFFLGMGFVRFSGSGQWEMLGLAFDGLTAFFLLLLFIGQGVASLYGMSYMKEYEEKKSLWPFSLAWLAFLGSMVGVLITKNGFYFIFLWELMSLFSFLLVIFEHEKLANRTAAFIYFVMTHIGTVFLITAILYLYSKTGSFLFADWAVFATDLSVGEKNFLFLCFLVGFGTKAGLVPVHIWLPYAHPVAPSPVSALMSGVMVKIALYMMLRLIWLTLTPLELWWGVLVLALGVLSAFMGILFACVEQDVKRLLAYSTVENIGILAIALGTAMIAQALGYEEVVILAMVGFFWHGIHHLFFKSTLFMVAGNIIQATHTRRLEEMGGLLKSMPKTGLWALSGAIGLSALPPLGGFWGEWLLFHSLWKASQQVGTGLLKLVLPLIIAVLAIVSALALATMVKWFSGAFLGQARSVNAKAAQELPWPQTTAMGMAILLTLLPLFWPQGLLRVIGAPLQVLGVGEYLASSEQAMPIFEGFFSLVTPYVLLLALFVGVLYLLTRGKQRRVSGTWNCGVPLTPRMQYTSSGITMPLRMMFEKILAFHFEEIFYRPPMKLLLWCANRVRILQTGSIHTYLAYILVTLVVVLIWTI